MSRLSQNGPVGPGARVGRYEIESFLGAGGMGQVYVARDTTLDRRVALKVLPAGCTADRVARFLREARAASALNHPGIVSVYDAGEDGVPFLAMELIDGQPLSVWMRGRRNVRRAIELMAQVAEGLARAHAAGIVHRDIKPDNILVGEGFAKVVDFGVAKLTERNDGEDGHTAVKTVDGALIGTISYMSPEQTEAGPVDFRSDIFSFGVVLYEVVSGRHPFQKERQVDTLHAIAHDTPSLEPIPEQLRRIVRRCLEKEPDARYHSMKDVAHDLRDVLTAGDLRSGTHVTSRWLWLGAAVLIVAAAVGLTRFVMTRAAAPSAAHPVRMSIVPPPGHQFEFLGGAGAPMISPDGHSIVFTAARDGKRQLWLRRLDTIAPEPLAGTEGAINPFWSPDSRSIGFFAEEKLKRIDIGGGEPTTICDAPLGRGGTWNQNDTILFAGRATPIMRISASGGTPVAVTELDRSEGDTTHRWPVFLPDGRHFLFIAGRSGAALVTNTICVGSLDRKMRKVVMNAATHALYFDGHLLYVRGGTLHGQRFDEETLAVIGEPVILPERQIDLDFGFTRSLLSVSPAGTLVYQAASSVQATQLTWFDRSGNQLGVVDQPALFASIALSPDERFVYAGYRPTTAQSNIWSYDLQRGVKTRLTFGNTRDSWPIPSPDGKTIAYAAFGSAQERQANVRLRDLATGMEKVLLQRDFALYPTDWSRDGRSLLIASGAQGPASSLTRSDIFWLEMGDQTLQAFMQTPDIETGGRFSPDGKWVAYSSDEGGPMTEIYLAPFPPTGAKWQVSDQGGLAVRWRADGKELFYVTPDSRLMAVPIVLGETPSIGRPVELFPMRTGGGLRFVYAATGDGQRFLVGTATGEEELPPLTVVEHFGSALRAATQQRRSAVTP